MDKFICALCGKEYTHVFDRAQCEIECTKKKEEEEKKVAAAKKAAEKKLRKEAVDEAVANTVRLVNAYINDFGSYEYAPNAVKDCIWPSRIWHYFG
jgi:hypothetical protein